jgi:His/Glu/Gln/Arg/opine family amino acid ABC transporter permease subunit
MLDYDWHFDRLLGYQGAFFSGVLYTLELSAALIVFSTVLGVVVGLLIGRNNWWATVARIIVDVLRGLPPLVLILFGYFALTADVIGITVGAFWVFVLSIGLNVAAFIADLTRASISNVPREYVEIGTAMGLHRNQLIRFVVLPMAVRELVPPMSYLYVEAIKLTSLASVINVRETVYVAQTIISNTARSLEVWVVVGAIYLVIVLPALFTAKFLEQRLKKEVGLAPAVSKTFGY